MATMVSLTNDTAPPPLPPVCKGKRITILSIDGGGIRGLIPACVLEFLESKLQELDGPEARIVDYFDVIAGTSTGGLVTAMLTTPNEQGRPLYAAKDIANFYLENCPLIFPQYHRLNFIPKLWGMFIGPQHDGKHLHSTIRGLLKETKLSDTLTNIVIPAFDIKLLQPVIFTTFAAKRNALKNALLSDVCLSTSAAPTFLPGHHFETKDVHGNTKTFDMIDGGVVANNPNPNPDLACTTGCITRLTQCMTVAAYSSTFTFSPPSSPIFPATSYISAAGDTTSMLPKVCGYIVYV